MKNYLLFRSKNDGVLAITINIQKFTEWPRYKKRFFTKRIKFSKFQA